MNNDKPNVITNDCGDSLFFKFSKDILTFIDYGDLKRDKMKICRRT